MWLADCTPYQELEELLQRAKTEPVRVHVVWCPSNWRMCSGTITAKSHSTHAKGPKGPKNVNCFDTSDSDGGKLKGDHNIHFRIGDTTGFYASNRYFTNYWLAWAYYTRMTKAAA